MKTTAPRIIAVACLCIFAICSTRAATTTLIPFGDPWRYDDSGDDPGAGWFGFGYGDGDWSFNFGEFGYGDGDEQTETDEVLTTYFRRFVNVPNPATYVAYTMRIRRDDGVAVYINGVEVLRNNMPGGAISHTTRATTALGGQAETTLVVTNLPPSVFVAGANLLAVSIHQAVGGEGDMSFDFELVGTDNTNPPPPGVVSRGPYLQMATSSNIVIRWRTTTAMETVVRYGTNLGALNLAVTNTDPVINHEITLPGLLPETKYYYSIGTSTHTLTEDPGCNFITLPLPGTVKPIRIWAIGDFGTANTAQRNVRNAYTNYSGTRHTDAWLFLGDNAYNTGTDLEYQNAVFNIYSNELKRMVSWPTMGNHDSAFQTVLSDNFPYYEIFTMPTAGEAGGVPSGSEHYYSYDYGNVHFIVLDSMTTSLRQPGSAMLQWLQADLEETTADWIIAYFHHPPYTKGSHNSDTEHDLVEIRQYVVPVLENGGVDLVLVGHSHSYERSYLINGHYGFSSTITAGNYINDGDGRTNGDGAYLKPAGGLGAGQGTVYIVDGSSGGQGGGGSLNHPAMYYSTLTYGSLVLDVNGLRLDGAFITSTGTTNDTFTMIKGDFPGSPRPVIEVTKSGTSAVMSWPTSHPEYHLESAVAVPTNNWLPITSGAFTNGRRKIINVPMVQTNEFFQLRRSQ